MKNRISEVLNDKVLLVMSVLGLVILVAAAGVFGMDPIREKEENPYLSMQEEMPELLPGQTAPETAPVPPKKPARPAGSADAIYQKAEPETEAAEAEKTGSAAAKKAPFYNGTDRLAWPVKGKVVLDYSMETSTYFQTLDQYRCNPALIIQGEENTPVYAPADAVVTRIGSNEEIGSYVALDLGNEYAAVCGQLKDIQVKENEPVSGGMLLGYLAQPTKYYTLEGTALYFELQHGGKPVDGLDFLQ